MPEWNKFRWVLTFVFVAWGACFAFALWGPWEMGGRGQFGDVFGSVNALFSGLAFVGLIYTIMLQRSELLLQRQELALQREEMAKSREALTEQALVQARQFQAAIVQVKVSAREAELQALRMHFDIASGSLKPEAVENALKISAQIFKYATELEAI